MLREPILLTSISSALLSALCLTACSSGAENNGPFNGPTTQGDTSSGTSPTTGDDATTATVTVGEDSTSDGSSGDTTTPSVETSSTGAPGDAPAQLQWRLTEPTLDYGDIPVDGVASTVILLENVGEHLATSMATGTIPGDFSFPGGYPGTRGSCGTELEPAQTCRLDLRFGPTQIGPVQSSLSIEYYDGVNLGSPTQTEALTLRGGGQGVSANLLSNGDAETGNTQGWQVPTGLANWTTTGDAFGGSFAFTPTGAIVVTALDQSVDLSGWQDETSVPGLQYRVRARVRSNTGAHDYRVYIDLGDDFFSLSSGAQTDWTLVEHIAPLPAEVETATVRIECANNIVGAGPCDVSFDDVALQLLYPGP